MNELANTNQSGKSLALSNFTPEQLELIKKTVAKDATNDELKLFLYRCHNMGLDPLKPGQIHFVKFKGSPGTIVVGIEGFRSRAAKTGKHTGTKRGVMRDKNGKCVGAWCEVYRSDWQHPAREEVSLSEYNTGNNQWKKMPETMIKKVAEVAALRMAFPDELGGVYSEDELGNVPKDVTPPKAPIDQNQVSKILDSVEGSQKEPEVWTPEKYEQQLVGKTKKELLQEVQNVSHELNIPNEEITGHIKELFGKTSRELNEQELIKLCVILAFSQGEPQ